MESQLELLVKYDMYENGYNPNDKNDIQKYWNERLTYDYTIHQEELHLLHKGKDDSQ